MMVSTLLGTMFRQVDRRGSIVTRDSGIRRYRLRAGLLIGRGSGVDTTSSCIRRRLALHPDTKKMNHELSAYVLG